MMECSQLEKIFADTFSVSEKTRLVGVEGEPLYSPWHGDSSFAEIRYVKNSLASALHEISHWCVAGRERRKVVDYGYWYRPDGRNAEEQKEFESLEIKPQAMEWLLSSAVGRKFVISSDNLNGKPFNSSLFRANVRDQAMVYYKGVKPLRFALLLANCLTNASDYESWRAHWEGVFLNEVLPDV